MRLVKSTYQLELGGNFLHAVLGFIAHNIFR